MSQLLQMQQSHVQVFFLGAVFCYLAPDLASQSLALDGLVYGNIAKLLASGEGSFWQLPFYHVELPRFTDHPPLGIYIHSLWMTSFGTEWWVDKLYAGCLTLVWFWLVLRLPAAFKVERAGIDPSSDLTPATAPTWGLIVLLAILPPVTYTLKNAFLETPLSVVILLATWCCSQTVTRQLWAIPAGLLTAVAVLIKGPVGLFPMAVPGIMLLANGWHWPNLWRACVTVLVMGLTAATFLSLTLLAPNADSWLSAYLQSQVVDSITGARPVEHGRGYQLQQLGICLAILTLVVVLLNRGKPRINSTSLMWLVMGLAYVLPLLISARHYRHYLLPALPFFAIAAWTMLPSVRGALIQKVKNIWWLPGAGALLWMVIIWGSPGDDTEEIRDTTIIAAHPIPDGLTFCSDASSLKRSAYLFRLHGIKTTAMAAAWQVCRTSPGPGFQVRETLSEGALLWHKPLASADDD